MFQSTRPYGARQYVTKAAMVKVSFQSTRPYGARPTGWPALPDPFSFNPRARTGRDNTAKYMLRVYAVSIHAPVRGATPSVQCGCLGCQVSIHAPVRGATLKNIWDAYIAQVSIHAPVRGATVTSKSLIDSSESGKIRGRTLMSRFPDDLSVARPRIANFHLVSHR